MSHEFDFDMDMMAELASIRGETLGKRDKKEQAVARKAPVKQPQKQADHGRGGSSQTTKPAPDTKPTTKPAEHAPVTESHAMTQEIEGMKVEHQQQERPGGGSSQATTTNDVPKTQSINWRTFKALPGVFEITGGDRPVTLVPNIKRSQVSGIPEPFFDQVQATLKARHLGAVVSFPWGDYPITDKNKVFTAKASLSRYLMFDGLRDGTGIQVQYAKQWLALHHKTAFHNDFNPALHLNPANDELDIYALIYVAHDWEQGVVGHQAPVTSSIDGAVEEQLHFMQMNMRQILEKLQMQEDVVRQHAERSHTVQTILLLDRMGLLKGGLPQDVEALARVLEENRSEVRATGVLVDSHIHAEKEREQRLARERRLAMRRS